MILVALGSNRDGPWGSPLEAVTRALRKLNTGGLKLKRASSLVQSSPFGRAGQPDFVNAVAEIETALPPQVLMQRLHLIERMAGRRRALRWGPRTLDLDLLDYHGQIRRKPRQPVLPHPGMPARIFVLAPIMEIAPRWRHPQTRRTARIMLGKLDPHGQGALL